MTEASIEFITMNLHHLEDSILEDIQNRIMVEKLKKIEPNPIYGCSVCGTDYHQLMKQRSNDRREGESGREHFLRIISDDKPIVVMCVECNKPYSDTCVVASHMIKENDYNEGAPLTDSEP